MARTRSIVLGLEVCISKKANNSCAHNRKGHPVPRGDTWLRVTDAGATASTKGYCVPCARKILTEAKAIIEARLAEIDEADEHGPSAAAATSC